ncbi:nitroreductase family protein [Massilia sp.]|uniref:nitroreductase family protein n=1 Tax=Massilia sp. TaxID=1882437 RepID=UPI00289C5197|nr:nitroreductase family protein [Massilia sp.]
MMTGTRSPDTDDYWSALAARRHVSLRRLVAPGPDAAQLQRIVEAAAHAPDHGLLLPWRFVLIGQERRADLGDVFAEALLLRDPACGPEALAAARAKAFHAPCLLVAVARDNPDAKAIPKSEKLVSLGCAIQNVLVGAQALGFASGLASGNAMDSAGMRRLLRLEATEQAICFIGVGTASSHKAPRARPALDLFFSTL